MRTAYDAPKALSNKSVQHGHRESTFPELFDDTAVEPPLSGHQRVIAWALPLLCYMTISSLVMLATVSSNWFHTVSDQRSTLSHMVYGTAHRPYVYRMLTPFTIRVMVSLTPGALRQHIENKWHQIGRIQDLGPRQGLEEGYVLEYACALALMYGSLLGFAYVCRALASALYHAPSFIPAFAPVMILGSLPIFAPQYVYDFPNLLLFSVCLLLIYRRRWAWFYPVFIAASFSKETSMLLVAISALYLAKRDRKAFWLHSSVQGVLWVSITVFIRFLFHDNPGALAEFHLLDHNLGLLLDPTRYVFFDSLLLPRGLNVSLWLLTGTLVFSDWQEKPNFLKRAVLMCPVLIAANLVWGMLNEIRVLLEVWPIVAMLTLPTIGRIFGVPIRATESL